MIELLIDGMPVVLPEDFDLTMIEENVYLTKKGEYSLDLTLSLDNPTNARIYKHIHRPNSNTTLKDRKAILIADNRVYINGVEAITEYTNRSVTIQLLSGNSELNFLGSDKKVRELDLGSMPAFDYGSGGETERTLWHKKYPETDYAYPTIKTSSGDVFNQTYFEYPVGRLTGLQFAAPMHVRPQPFLMCYFRKIADAVGFSLVENCLEGNELFNRLYLCNSKLTWSFAEILPDWTLNEFFTHTETFFNVSYVVNKTNKTIRILNNTEVLKNNVTTIQNVLDDYTVPIDSENSIEKIDYDYVEYNVDSGTDYAYSNVDDEILDKLTQTEYANYAALLAFINQNPGSHASLKEIFHVVDTDNYYIYHPETNGYSLRPANWLKGVGDNTQNKITLNIVPAPIDTIEAHFKWPFKGTGPNDWVNIDIYRGNVQVPVIPTQSAAENQAVYQMIEEGLSKSDASDKMYISIYAGVDYCRDDSGVKHSETENAYYPWSRNDNFLSFTWANKVEKKHYPLDRYDAICDTWTLRLRGSNGLHSLLYAGTPKIDVTKQFVFDFIVDFQYSITDIFIIKNRPYICAKIERKVRANQLSRMATGYFYPAEYEAEFVPDETVIDTLTPVKSQITINATNYPNLADNSWVHNYVTRNITLSFEKNDIQLWACARTDFWWGGDNGAEPCWPYLYVALLPEFDFDQYDDITPDNILTLGIVNPTEVWYNSAGDISPKLISIKNIPAGRYTLVAYTGLQVSDASDTLAEAPVLVAELGQSGDDAIIITVTEAP